MNITIVSDTICPWCFIGKRRLESALKRRPDIHPNFQWKPFELNPKMPKAGLDRMTYLRAKFGSDEEADNIYQKIENAGIKEHILFDFKNIARVPNTKASHSLIAWASHFNVQHSVAELIFEWYFEKCMDIGNIDTLLDIAEQAGLSRGEALLELTSNKKTQKILNEAAQANKLGITGVPCFIFDSKYVLSGAHEPEVLLKIFNLVQQKK